MEYLIYFDQVHNEYLDLPYCFGQALEGKVPSVLVITVGYDMWVFKTRWNELLRNLQLFGHTSTNFLNLKNIKRGSYLQFVISSNKIYLTDFDAVGVSRHYYYADDVGGNGPRCLVHADQSSPYRQILPVSFVNNLNCPLPKVLFIMTHINLYTVLLCEFYDGKHKGFHGEEWEKCYRDLNIYDECMLVFQHYWENDMFELKVYTPEGTLYPTVNHDSKQLIDHPYILFPGEEVSYNGDYQDVLSCDVNAAYWLVKNARENENVHLQHGATSQFKHKLDDKVLKKSALHIPIDFVRKRKLYQYHHATVICGTYKPVMSFVLTKMIEGRQRNRKCMFFFFVEPGSDPSGRLIPVRPPASRVARSYRG